MNVNVNRFLITAGLLLAVIASAAASVFVADKSHILEPTVAYVISDGTTAPPAATDAPAKIVLKAPDKAKIGQLVILDVSESTAANFKWELQQKTGGSFLVIDNGRRAVFSAEAGGDYTFVIAAANGNTVDVKIHTVKVAGGAPQPGDDIASKIAVWCEKIDYPQKRDDLLKLAQSFSSVSALISDSMSPADIVDATKKSNRDALGSNIQNWVPFLEGLQGELKSLAESGKLPDNESHRRMWRAIADGLKQYADTI
jgi:hypothetical protein